jgi:hypothetical protein
MSSPKTSQPTWLVNRFAASNRFADALLILRRESVVIVLLVTFTILIGLVNYRSSATPDELYQDNAARKSAVHIATHDPQGQPFYGLLVHVAMKLVPNRHVPPVRVPAFLAGILIPLVFYTAHRRWAGREAALIAAVMLAAIDPVRFYMSIGRGYTLLVLGALVLNQLTLSYLRWGGRARLALYIPIGVATCFTHLWAFPLVGGHALFAGFEFARRRRTTTIKRRSGQVVLATVATMVLAIVVYLPMSNEIRAVAAKRETRVNLASIFDAVLQLPRIQGWTIAAHLLMVPIILEGFARRPLRLRSNRTARLYISTILVVLAWASVVHSEYFGSRYLLAMLPAAAGLVAWGLSGYWRPSSVARPLPILPRPATWCVGLGLGMLSLNASVPHEIWGTHSINWSGRDSTYFFRDLAQWLGTQSGEALLVAGLVGLLLRSRWPRPTATFARSDELGLAHFWTAVLGVSLIPVVFCPDLSRPLMEVHMVAVAAVLLDAWEHRFNDAHLRALVPGFIMVAAVAVAWQMGITKPRLSPASLVGIAMYLPALLLIVPLARTTQPSLDGQARSAFTQPSAQVALDDGRI